MISPTLTVLYGSQTGIAQEVAERIWREAKRHSFKGCVLAMDEYEIQNLIHETLVIFVCSTTGQGDQPDNMKKTWRFLLKKSLPLNSLQNMRFGVLGLGDSSYVKFNHAAKKLFKRLLQLGGKHVIDPAYADDQHDLGADAVIDPWISELWSKIADTSSIESQRILDPPRWVINVLNEESNSTQNIRNEELLKSNSAIITCIGNERVTSENHFQDTRLIKFTAKNLNYAPGDVLMVKAQNSDEAVEQFFEIFRDRKDEISENFVISVGKRFPDMPVPYGLEQSVGFRKIVKEYFDLNVVPRRYTFELLSYFTDSELEREKLIEFTTPEGQQELYTYCNRPKRTILEVLADFPHAVEKIPVEYLFEIFQPIRSRAFSIASSPKVHTGEVHILVAVVRYKTNLKKPRIGLCSNWLASLQAGDEIVVHLRKGSFSFPSNNVPMIMVGPGTGIAPFRSYVHESADQEGKNKNYIFFGCRGKTTDFYFWNEWPQLEAENKVQLFTAFSRDQSEKIYVQHVITQNDNEVGLLIVEQKAHIFVAGNSKNMPEAVKEAFISSCMKVDNSDEDSWKRNFERMELNGRYQTETWS